MPQCSFVVRRSLKSAPLPQWIATFTLIISVLRQAKLFDELAQRSAIPRQGGYGGLDLLVTGLAFFLAPNSGGIKGFFRDIQGKTARIAAIADLRELPKSTATSGLLSAADRLENPDEFVGWLLTHGSGCRDLLRSPLVQARDTMGRFWSVFDFDPTVSASRERALPEGEDLPPPRRRHTKLCAKGYCGRKRGDTQFSTAMLSHAGAGLWMHASVWPGNTPFAQAIGIASKTVANAVDWAGLDLPATLLRFDGAGGHHDAIAAVVDQGVHYLTRLGSCHVLQDPAVMEFLSKSPWRPVADSGSGPRREAAELGSWALSKELFLKETSSHQALRSRLVVSRFAAAADGKKHGAGMVIGPVQYEVFATDLDAGAWPAPDTVTLYYGRCGQENAFLHSNKELHLGASFSKTPHGQRLMTAIGMWTANLLRVAAVQLLGNLGDAPEQEPRPVEPASSEVITIIEPTVAETTVAETTVAEPSPPEIAEPSAPCAPVVPPDSAPPVPPKTVLTQVPRTRQCTAGALIPLSNLRFILGSRPYAIYRGTATTCGVCVTRQGCTNRQDPSYRREFGVPIRAELIAHRVEILAYCRTTTPEAARAALPPRSQPAPRSPGPRLTMPPVPAAGPWQTSAPSLYMPVLLECWRTYASQHRVEVTLEAPVRATAERPWIRQTSARRQCRRQTWTEKRAYNALKVKAKVVLTQYAA